MRFDKARPSGLGTFPCVVEGLGQQSCAGWAIMYWMGFAICVLAILTKWFSFTRLETRTKESNIYASIWVFKTLMRNESKGNLVLLR